MRAPDPACIGSRHEQHLVRLLSWHAAGAVAVQPLHARVAHHVIEARAQRIQQGDQESGFDLRLRLGQTGEK